VEEQRLTDEEHMAPADDEVEPEEEDTSLSAQVKRIIEELGGLTDNIIYDVMLGRHARALRIPKKELHNAVEQRRRQRAGIYDQPLNRNSHVEIARWLVERLQNGYGNVVYDDGDFWHYDTTHWLAFRWDEMQRRVHDAEGMMIKGGGSVSLSQSKIEGVLRVLGAILAQPKFFADAPRGINCKSGFIEFDDKGKPTLDAPSPDHRQRHVLPGSWAPGKNKKLPKTSLLHKLLSGCFKGDPHADSKIATLQEVAGSAASGAATKLKEPKVLVMWGEDAENGKGQIGDAFRGLLPASAFSAVSPSEFGDKRALFRMVNSLLNISDELGTSHAIASDKFKSIVTGDPLSAAVIYKPQFEFRPVAQHVFSANNLPSFAGGMDRGVQRRLLVMKFLRTIPKSERIADLGKRIADEEADLLLAWAVEGASRLIERGRFEDTQWATDALAEWTQSADVAVAWCNACVEHAPGERLEVGRAYGSFTIFASSQGNQSLSQHSFTPRARAELAKRRIRYAHGGNFRGFLDARLARHKPMDTNAAWKDTTATMAAAD
jgi:phage/plasmid-associated DNA primase